MLSDGLLIRYMLNFTFSTIGLSGKSSPKIKIISTQEVITIPDGIEKISFDIVDNQQLNIDFFNKSQDDTILDHQGNIVKDTQFRITDVWCDGIKLESWFLTDAVYYPRYFAGFLEQFPSSPGEIKSPYQFNFPGTISWQWQESFWDWYFIEKNKKEVINFLEQDPDRVWKFRGSLDPCDDIVQKIKTILKL